MTILSSLVKAYDRLHDDGDLPPFGYARVEVGFCIVLQRNGSVAFDPVDLRLPSGRKVRGPKLAVPAPLTQRTSGIKPNFLWDKSAYSLGLTSKPSARTELEHSEFVSFHKDVLKNTSDDGLSALLAFLERWNAGDFTALEWSAEIVDANIVFALENEYRQRFLHQRPAAVALWSDLMVRRPALDATCLVLGTKGRIADSHPPIKGVDNAQSSGAFIVSFNDDAYQSYGHSSGDNAPISEAAAFAYTTVLNRFLERDSGHRIQIGDASTVFWADASEMDVAKHAEVWGGLIFGIEEIARGEETDITKDIRYKLARLVGGAKLKDVEPKLADGVTFHVLGLSPNAARISIRFYWQGSFGTLADNYRHYMRDMAFEPWPRDKPQPTIRRCVTRLGPARIDRSGKVSFDLDQVPQQFAGELLRAIVSGNRFPDAMLGLLLMRIRNDHLVDPTRVAMIKAVLARALRLRGKLPKKSDGTEDKDYLMKADADDPNVARRLGQLFALMERVQSASLGEEINATIKDKFLSAAAATPQQTFPRLLQLSEHHVTRLRRGHSDADWVANAAKRAGVGTAEMARRIGSGLGAQIGRLAATFYEAGFPTQHDNGEQGYFMIGYYQERYARRPDADGNNGSDFDADIANETDEG